MSSKTIALALFAATVVATSSTLRAQSEAQPAVGPDRVKAQWIGWEGGKPSAHSPAFNLARKKA